LAWDTKGDKDTRIYVERCREEVDNPAVDVIGKLALVRLFPLGHEVIYCASKDVYNSTL